MSEEKNYLEKELYDMIQLKRNTFQVNGKI
jgi:hypothetical protein